MSNEIERRGLMLVLSSPSGAGKTTLSRRLLESDPHRHHERFGHHQAAAQGEVEGKDYFFVSPSSFQGMAKGGGFLEHAQVFGHHYGTPKEPVMMALAKGRDVLFDIDWQGTQQLRQQAGDDLVSIFVLPPSMPNWSAACASAPRTPKMWWRRAWRAPATRSAIGRNMIMW